MAEHVHVIREFTFSDGRRIERCIAPIAFVKNGKTLWYEECTLGDATRASVLQRKKAVTA